MYLFSHIGSWPKQRCARGRMPPRTPFLRILFDFWLRRRTAWAVMLIQSYNAMGALTSEPGGFCGAVWRQYDIPTVRGRGSIRKLIGISAGGLKPQAQVTKPAKAGLKPFHNLPKAGSTERAAQIAGAVYVAVNSCMPLQVPPGSSSAGVLTTAASTQTIWR